MIPWDRISSQYGYKSPEAMFKAIYATQSIAQLSTRFGCSVTAIRDALKKYNIEVRKRGGPQPSAGLEAISFEEYKAKGARAIADEYDCDITTVYKHFKRRSEPPPPTVPTSGESPEKTQPEDPEPSR